MVTNHASQNGAQLDHKESKTWTPLHPWKGPSSSRSSCHECVHPKWCAFNLIANEQEKFIQAWKFVTTNLTYVNKTKLQKLALVKLGSNLLLKILGILACAMGNHPHDIFSSIEKGWKLARQELRQTNYLCPKRQS